MSSSSRPLRSFALEAAVIVGSILLAFSVDAWWDGVVEDREETRLLDRLEDEFDLFETTLIPAAARRSDATLRSIDLLEEWVHGVRDVPGDTLAIAVSLVPRSYQFAAATPVFDLLTSDGGYARIDDPELSEALSQIASHLELVRRFEQLSDGFVADALYPWLRDHVDLAGAANVSGSASTTGVSSAYRSNWTDLKSREFGNLLHERRLRLDVVVLFRQGFGRAVADARSALQEYRTR